MAGTIPSEISWRGRDYGKSPAAFDRDAYVYACAQALESERRERRVPEPGKRWNCKACGEPLIGAITKHGKVAPIEVAENEQGNCVLFWRDGKVHTSVIGADAREHIGEMQIPIHHNHFATCVAAEQFRHRTE